MKKNLYSTLAIILITFCSCGNSNSNKENNVENTSTQKKNNLIEINYAVEFRNGKPYNNHCNYGSSDYSYRGTIGGYGTEYLSGTITVPKGKMWIYKELTNFYFADNQITDKSFEIIEKGQFNSRSRENWVRINYEGQEKELVFSKSYKKEVENAKFVSFEIQKGFLGFDIIKNKKLE